MSTEENKEQDKPTKTPPGTPNLAPVKEPGREKEVRQVTPSSDEASYYKDEQTDMGGEEFDSDDLSDQQDKTRQ